MAKPGDVLIELKNIPGPITLVRYKKLIGAEERAQLIKKAEQLTQYYSTKARNKKILNLIIVYIKILVQII